MIEAEIRKNTDLATLADEFRLCANELVDMLDGRMPVVSRLKVRMFFKSCCCCLVFENKLNNTKANKYQLFCCSDKMDIPNIFEAACSTQVKTVALSQ